MEEIGEPHPEYDPPIMPTPGFESQAGGFDRRAGLPAEAAARVAEAVVGAAAPFLGDSGLLLEIGAGTGVVGADLAGLVPRYLGLDLAGAMLLRFRGKLAEGHGLRAKAARGVLLIQADADAPWPVASRRAGALFLSRTAHRLDPEHLVEETLRVADPRGAVLVLGGVRREEGSVRRRLRKEMRRLLAEQGVEGRSRERTRRRLAEAFETRGGRAEAPRAVASWERIGRPADALAAWRGKPGLAGREVPAQLQEKVLLYLEAWARERWGDLHQAHSTTETYELTVIRLP